MATRLFEIIFKSEIAKQEQTQRSRQRFVHYTSAESALKIIQSRKFFMRNSAIMNDYSEVEYGLGLIGEAMQGPQGLLFKQKANQISGQFVPSFEIAFRSWERTFRTDTYIASISEHDDNEDEYGRLSMWRAYGGRSGIALVLNQGPFLRPSDALRAYTFPVQYHTIDETNATLSNLTISIDENIDFLQKEPFNLVVSNILQLFATYVLRTKHPGFKEEREWRVISSPVFGDSDNLLTEIACLSGIPQIVRAINLADIPLEGLYGMEPNKLLNRIIIGPTQHPLVIFKALRTVLSAAGVENVDSRIAVSRIPLRTHT